MLPVSSDLLMEWYMKNEERKCIEFTSYSTVSTSSKILFYSLYNLIILFGLLR
jgi:hypothetical protein